MPVPIYNTATLEIREHITPEREVFQDEQLYDNPLHGNLPIWEEMLCAQGQGAPIEPDHGTA